MDRINDREEQSKKRCHSRGPLAVLALCALLLPGCSAWGWGRSEAIVADLIDGFGAATVEDEGFAAKYTDLLRYEKIFRNPYGVDSPRLVKVGFEIDAGKMFQSVRRSLYLGATRRSPCGILIPLAADARGATLVFSLGGLGVRNARCELSIAMLRSGRRDGISGPA